MDLAYYKINKLLWRWSKKEGARIVREARLSMERAPPVLSAPSPPAPIAKVMPLPRRPKPDPIVKMAEDLGKVADAFSRFKTWLNTPNPPKQSRSPKPAVLKEEKVETVPPFDIQEIPGAMRNEHMPIAAKLMERWFAGRLNYSPTGGDEVAEINQDGKPYPPDMYDATTIKLDWVLKFSRAKEQFDYLINEAIRSPKALDKLHKKLLPYKGTQTIFDAAEICKNDTADLHRHFQFQFSRVDGTLGQKINLFLKNIEHGGVPDDLTGALGAFNFYAAVGHVRFHLSSESRRARAEVKGIWVYVKDSYTFTDEQGDRSQYLGHWSRDGVIVIPLDAIAATSSYIPYIESPVTLSYVSAAVSIGQSTINKNVYYPVHNGDFRRWALKHQRGGDFVVYSDRRYVPVVPPITVYL